MEDILNHLIDSALKSDCSYADCRYVEDRYELLEAKNGSPSRLSNSKRFGIGIRVLRNGAWGFASTNDLEKATLYESLKKAIKIAEVTSISLRTKKGIIPEKSYIDMYTTPHKVDPFSIEPDEKIEPLKEGTKLLAEPQTKADIGELLRTIGFSSSPGTLRIFGIIPVIGNIVNLVCGIWMLVAMIIAVRQALDYKSTWRAIAVCLVGFIVQIIVFAFFFQLIGNAGAA